MEAKMVPSGTVTFLFTDIEGSTRLLERLREGYAHLLEDQRLILRNGFARWNGHEIDTQGDSFFASFSRAIDALGFVIETQRALAAHAWPEGAAVLVRMGLHTGEPLILGGGGYVGMDVHQAARIAASGHGGQVLLSQTARDLVYQDLPRGVSIRDLGAFKLKDIRFPQQIYQLEIEGLASEFPPLKTLSADEEPPTPGEPPYKGLVSFEEQDAAWFFGREAVTQTLLQAIQEQRFLAVIGASGSGKSSILRAGLIPAFKRSLPDWQVYLLTPTNHPIESLALSLTRQDRSPSATSSLIDELRADPRNLHLFLKKPLSFKGRGDGDEAGVLIVIDQFEELFTLCRDEAERQVFIDGLIYAVVHEGGPISLVIALRADFYNRLAQYDSLRQMVARRQEYLGVMTAAELRQAIEEPARLGGWEFSPGLVDLMLHDIGASEGRSPEPGALPLLSHALLETWKRRRGNTMRLKSYAEAGGVRRAIARTAEAVYYGEFSPDQQHIARSIFLRLTEPGEGEQDTRRRAALIELVPAAGGMGEGQVTEVLNRLADARLVTISEGNAEVAHEALIREWPALREWLTQDREGLRTHRRLTETAIEWQRLEGEPGTLYRGARLAQALEWAGANPGELNDLEQQFLEASRQAIEQEQVEQEAARQRELEAAQKLAQAEHQRAEERTNSLRRLRQRAYLLLGALVVAGVLAALAFQFARRSQANARLAQNESNSRATQQAIAEAEADSRATQQALAESETSARATAESIAILEKENAEQQANLASSRELAVTAINNLEDDPELSILLSLQALRTAYSREAEGALHQAIQASRVRMTLPGYEGGAQTITYSPDGKTIAISNLTGKVFFRDAKSGKALFDLPGWGARFSPDGSTLATGSWEGPIILWDFATQKKLHTLSGHTGRTWRLQFSPDGALLLAASMDPTFTVWDVKTGQVKFSSQDLVVDNEELYDVVFSPDGNLLFAAYKANDPSAEPLGTVRIWRVGGNWVLLNEYPSDFMSFTFSPKGNWLVTSGTGNGIFLQDISNLTGEKLASHRFQAVEPETVPKAHESFITNFAFSPDESLLVTGSIDSTAKIWRISMEGVEPMMTLSGHAGPVGDVSFSPDGTRLATASADGTARIWDFTPAGNSEWFTLDTHTDSIQDFDLTSDGKYMATASQDGTAKVWDLDSGTEMVTIPNHGSPLRNIAISPDGSLLVTAGDDNQAKLWKLDFSPGTASADWLHTIEEHADGEAVGGRWPGLTSAVFSPDGTLLATGGVDQYARVWEVQTGQQKLAVPANPDGHGVTSLAFSPDGKYLATTGSSISHPDGPGTPQAKIWDLASGEEISTFSGHFQGQRIWGMDFSPNGKHVATGVSRGLGVKIWDLHTGQELLYLEGHSATVDGLDFSPDGKYLVTSSIDGTARVWDASTGEELLSIVSQRVAFSKSAFTPDGKKVIVAWEEFVSGFIFDLEDLVHLAETRVTRWFTLEECRQFLHQEECPPR